MFTTPTRRRRLMALAAVLVSAATLGADVRRASDRFVGHVELAPVATRELFPAADGDAIEVSGSIEAALARPLTVVRDIPVAWELRIPSDTRVEDLEVDLEISGRDGRSGQLTGAGGRAVIPVSLTAGRPRVIRREARSLVVAGSARLRLRVEDVEQAGRFEGTLTVHLVPR